MLLSFKLAGTTFLVPFLVAIAMYFGGLCVFGPKVYSDYATKFGNFFFAAATVTAAALVALALEARQLTISSRPVSRLAAGLAFIYAVAAEVAGVAALSPSLPRPEIYQQAFAITVGGGSGLLAAVLLVGLRGVNQASADEERTELKALADQGDAGAKFLLGQSH
ncbi:MAG: hypothetical protein JO027_19550 [Solirubrobacterales bacterium]|nr:hypothetical protein [Solirubrobacterales bacterium]